MAFIVGINSWVGPLLWSTCLMWHQFLEGVSFLYTHGIAHLDLKPLNILVGHVDELSSQPKVSLIDCSIFVCMEGEMTDMQGYCGTPFWTAPEVGVEYGLPTMYSQILPDQWSCG